MARQRALPSPAAADGGSPRGSLQQSLEPEHPLPPPPSPSPPFPQTHPNPPQPSQDHTPEGTSTLQRHLFLACLPAYDICDPSPGTPLVPCAAKAQVVLPAAPHRRAPGLSPPSLWCRIITSVLSRWISRADLGLTAAIALPKRSKQRTRQAPGKRARSLAFFLFSTTRETQKGTSTPGPIFSDQSLARSPPRPRLHRRQHTTYCTVRGCLASRFPLSAFRSLSCCCWWHRIAVDVVWRKGSENSAPVEFPEFHPLSRPRPDQDEPAAGETDD